MKKRKKKVWGAKFRKSDGSVGLVLASNMTMEDCVRLGVIPKLVPKGEPVAPDTLIFDPEKDMPNDI